VSTPSAQASFAPGLAPFGEALAACAEELRRTITDNEQDFLAVGESIVGFFGGATAFSGSASGLAESLGDGRFEALVDRLEGDAASVAQTCGDDCGGACANVLDVFDAAIAATHTHAAAFKRIVKQLQMLGISTRIESVRLGNAGGGFQTLADDVEQLAGRIVEDFEAINDRTKALGGTIADFRARSKDMAALQQQCVADIAGTLGNNVSALRDVHARARQSSAALSDQAAQISQSMSGVVAAIQSHDIIRQQVEHVAEVLEETVAELAGHDGGDGDGGEQDMLLGWVADVGALQAAQLDHSRGSFMQAMDEVAASLGDIAGAVADSMRTVEEALSADGRGGAEIIDDVRKGTGHVLEALARYEELDEAVAERIASLAAIVEAIFTSLENIEEVGAEIELIALNASIKSARVGAEGRALSVLAESIQKLSAEAREHKDRFSETTEGIRDAGASLKECAAAMLDRKGLEAFAHSQRDILEQLDAINAGMDEDLAAVRAQGAELSRSMRAYGQDLDIHHRMCPRFGDGVARLQELAAEAGSLHTGEAARRPERLEKILARYTMDSERMIHDRHTGGAAPASGGGDELWGEDELWDDGAPAPATAEAAEDDWDNVELF
jgi:methyl-accepting chemotaxis protein